MPVNTKLTHSFFFANLSGIEFFAEKVFSNDVDSLEKLERMIVDICGDKVLLNGRDPLSMMGDAWEAFREVYFHIFGIVPTVRVTDQKNASNGQKGYDWTFVNAKTMTIGAGQDKFIGASKKPWRTELKERNDDNDGVKLERFLTTSQNEVGVPVDETDNLIVFTNATGIDSFTSSVLLYGKVRCIGRKNIKAYVNNNPTFWKELRELIIFTNPKISF